MARDDVAELVIGGVLSDLVRRGNDRRLVACDHLHFTGRPEEQAYALDVARAGLLDFVAVNINNWKNHTLVIGDDLSDKTVAQIRHALVQERLRDYKRALGLSPLEQMGMEMRGDISVEVTVSEMMDPRRSLHAAADQGISSVLRSVCQIFDDLTVGRPFAHSTQAEEESDKGVKATIEIVQKTLLDTKSLWQPKQHGEAGLFGDCLTKVVTMYVDKAIHLVGEAPAEGKPQMRIAGAILTELGIAQNFGDVTNTPAETFKAMQMREMSTVFEYMMESAVRGKIMHEAVAAYRAHYPRPLYSRTDNRMMLPPFRKMQPEDFHILQRRQMPGQDRKCNPRVPPSEAFTSGVRRAEEMLGEIVQQMTYGVVRTDGYTNAVYQPGRAKIPPTFVRQ